MPFGRGIVGHVAESGELLNLPNVYDYPKFDPSHDNDTGFRTKVAPPQPRHSPATAPPQPRHAVPLKCIYAGVPQYRFPVRGRCIIVW